jgi:hypothetical protein
MSKRFTDSIKAAPGGTLYVEDMHAKIALMGTDQDRITVEVNLEVADSDAELLQRFVDESELVLEPYDADFRLRFVTPQNRSEGSVQTWFKDFLRTVTFQGKRRISVHTDITIILPTEFSVDLSNKFGDVRMTDVTGKLVVNNSAGKVDVGECGGYLDVSTSFGETSVRNFSGNIALESMSGNVTVERVAGTATVGNSFGDVGFQQIEGTVTIISQSGDVVGSNAKSNCKIKSSFGTVDVSNVAGDLDVTGVSSDIFAADAIQNAKISTSFGAVDAKRITGSLTVEGQSITVNAMNVEGDASIQSSFGQVRVEHIGGNLDVTSSSSHVTADDIAGDVNITNSFNDVLVRQTSGSIRVTSESGMIEVSDISLLPQNAEVSLKASFGSIRLMLKSDVDAWITASSEFGKIQSDFPVYLGEEGRSTVRINLGDEVVPIRIIARNGDIEIREE